MRLLAILPLLALAAGSPLEERAAKDLSAQVIQALKTLDADIHTLNTTLNTFQPNQPTGIFTAEQIQSETQTLNTDLQHATNLTRQSARWSQAHSIAVATTIIGLEPDIYSLLANIVKHKPAFATAVLGVGDLSQTVEQDLLTQRQLTATFGAAVVAKLDKSLQGLAPAQTKAILQHFDRAIQAYKTCTGTVCLPPIPSSP